MSDEPEDRLGMTEEQWRRFQEYTHGYGDQDENGVDLSLLRRNLLLTPTERAERIVRAHELLRELQRARATLRPANTDRSPDWRWRAVRADRRGCREHALVADLYGRTVRVASIPDLIAMKKAAGRAKHALHVQELEALRKLQDERGAS
jgi:hypothetical protein